MEAFLEEFQHLKIQLEDIKSATGNFDRNNVIGKGGFGMVYKGVLSNYKDRQMVAVKRLDRCYGQGDPEFFKEILMLSRYTHENLISLVGFCEDDGEKILVYEHAYHGSLDCHLSSTTLTWRQRLKICLAAAIGLCYLHDPNETQHRIIHRDIKSSNILLDENWNAKVSDMGLSKIGPANQKHTFLVSNVVGTFGYVDPTYAEKSILTKESDVYSFGVVLFEVLCGRLCFEYNNGHCESLVRMWKKRCKQKKLDEIIFKDLKQQMDLNSLETFSDIAYQCLQNSREERPKMYHVVEKLEIALRFQEIFEVVEPPIDYDQMSKTAVPPLVYRSKEELKRLLSNGIFINEGKTWFWLNKNGEHCEMISAKECMTPIRFLSSEYAPPGQTKSRFGVDYYPPFCRKFKTHVKPQFLSPHTTYTVNLVFNLGYKNLDYLGLNYILSGNTKSSTLYLADKREDGWLMAELYQFTSDRRNIDLEITFLSRYPLAVEGIEFLPLERVEHEVLMDMEVDIPTISDSETYWEQKLPGDYEEIIKWSKDRVKWTTKKELYSILCKGFPIQDCKEWLYLAKNGKKCLMISARMCLRKQEWSWQSLPELRFEEVAFDLHGSSFWLSCKSKLLSPVRTYAVYLVYKLQDNHFGFEAPVKVTDVIARRTYERNHSWYIFFLSPQTPVIRRKVYQNTHNPLNRPKIKGLPQQRNDGWMEVQVWKFQTNTKRLPDELLLTFFDNNLPRGLIVQGIEVEYV
ncbi:unnamed protein product [Lactuca virosa]|uniref:Protein kinase domain-containing protein n=1 Tax=Lactuca virosa TaxID=75947 RepID=A0AAU9MSD0_9ASTR|nr:unnamed protein product [Lactuca virosa]